MIPRPRLIAALVASAVTALLLVGALALGVLCIGLGWAAAHLGLTGATFAWAVALILTAAIAGVWWCAYRDAVERQSRA